jgi:hypothetical protein
MYMQKFQLNESMIEYNNDIKKHTQKYLKLIKC